MQKVGLERVQGKSSDWREKAWRESTPIFLISKYDTHMPTSIVWYTPEKPKKLISKQSHPIRMY